jgi:hypothetical protein
MKFLNERHESKYKELISLDKTYSSDTERQALFYLIAGTSDLYTNKHNIYDFNKHMLKRRKGLCMCNSASYLMDLGLNLYNSTACKNMNICDMFATLDNQHRKLALNAIQLRFPVS